MGCARAMTERIVAGGFAYALNHASTLLDKAAHFMNGKPINESVLENQRFPR